MNTLSPTRRHMRQALLFCAVLSLSATTLFAIQFDTTFGTSGTFTTVYGSGTEPTSGGTQILVQPSGRIILIGNHSQMGPNGRKSGVGMVGLTPAGAIDSGFGTAGKVLLWEAGFDHYLTHTLLLADGSILVFYRMWESSTSNRPKLAKFNPDGQRDLTFDPNLEVAPAGTRPVRSIVLNSGKIYALVDSMGDPVLIRLNPDGSRDTTFGTNGLRPLNLNRFYFQRRVFGMHELPNGKLLLAGNYSDMSFMESAFVVRLDTDLNLDRSFGTQGVTRISIPGGGLQTGVLRLQADGKILIAGSWVFLGSNTLLVRLTERGKLDSGFGSGGVVMNSFNNTNGIGGIVQTADGGIAVAGASGSKTLPSHPRILVIKYNSAGVMQSSLVSTFNGPDSAASDIYLQPNGKMLIAGFTINPNGVSGQAAIARLNP